MGGYSARSNFPTGIPNDFRLSLTTGVPVTSADVAAATTIYAVPYQGNSISLYNGTSWVNYSSNEFSLALGTLTNLKVYDVFCYANASGVPTLEFLVWTNTTTRATALVYQNGVLVKSGDATRRWMGSFYNPGQQSATVTMTIAAPCVVTYTAHGLPANAPVVFTTTDTLPTGIVSGTTYYVSSVGVKAANTFQISATPGGAVITTSGTQAGTHTCTVPTYTEVSANNVFLVNADNKSQFRMYVNDATTSWTYTTATFRQANANTNNQFNFICGQATDLIQVNAGVLSNNSTTIIERIAAVSLDSIISTLPTVDQANIRDRQQPGAACSAYHRPAYFGRPGIGLHYVAWLEYSTATGTCTWSGNNTSGLFGAVPF